MIQDKAQPGERAPALGCIRNHHIEGVPGASLRVEQGELEECCACEDE